jgi:NAD(P)-dependent dehydrogenase (short-subunit alcohol dehydrogenase family)
MSRPHVLIVGASGVFGSRLARLLAGRQAFRVTLAGRVPQKAAPLQSELRSIDPDGGYEALVLDRDRVTAQELRALDCQLVVDCSGPFQLMGANLIEAAIAAPCHYVDLADSRSFVAGIGRFDAAARKAGIAVIAGASSSPCLSNAVLDHLVGDWTSIDTIDCAIIPGNQTPKGKSVISGILSWVGQPVRVFREAEWQERAGWSGARTIAIDGVSPRRAMLADVPDLDIIPARFSPRVRAGFDAGMELPVLNALIGLSGLAVRLGLVRSARAFTAFGNLIANALDRFGSQDGGMLVEVVGLDHAGQPARATWQLKASAGHGPYVPIGPAAALIEQLLLSKQVLSGASSAAGRVALDAILPWYSTLSIQTRQDVASLGPALFARLLGDSFRQMPEVTQRLHRGWPAVIARGRATVQPATARPGRVLARIFGLPATPGDLPLEVVIESRDGFEYWTRRFGAHQMRSVMRAQGGLLVERFGPVSIAMRLVATPDGLDMRPVGGWFAGIPLLRFLLPSVVARETSADGRHVFEVEIGLPIIGRLVAYRGSLDV